MIAKLNTIKPAAYDHHQEFHQSRLSRRLGNI